MKLTYFLPLVLCLAHSFAGEMVDEKKVRFEKLILADGRILEQVVIREVGGDSVSVIHSSGTTTIAFDRLNPEDAKKLGFTKETVDAFHLAQKKEQLKDATAKLQKLNAEAFVNFNFYLMSSKILQVLPDGFLVAETKLWDGRSYERFQDPITDRWTSTASRKDGGVCYIHTATDGFADGQNFHAIIAAEGTKSYVSALGITKTVNAFHTDIGKACSEAKGIGDITPAALEALIRKQYSFERLTVKE